MLSLHQKRYSNVKVSCFIASFPLTFFKEKKKPKTTITHKFCLKSINF